MISALLEAVYLRYVLSQAALLPLVLLAVLWLPGRATLPFRWAVHRALLVLGIAFPLLLFSPGLQGLGLPWATVSQPVPQVSVSVSTSGEGRQAAGNSLAVVGRERDPGQPRSETAASALGVVLLAFRALFPFALALLSSAGLLVFGAGLLRQTILERRFRASATHTSRVGRLRIVRSPAVRAPFSSGILRPAIYLPVNPRWTARMTGMALAHEAAHLRGLHILWTFLEKLLVALFWMNPLASLVAKSGSRIRELLCDWQARTRQTAKGALQAPLTDLGAGQLAARLEEFQGGTAGTALITCMVSANGSIREPSILDTDIEDTSYLGSLLRLLANASGFRPVPSGKPVSLLLIVARVPVLTDAGGWSWQFLADGVGSDADSVDYIAAVRR